MSKNTRKNEAKTDISLFNFIKENRLYSNEWNVRKQTNEYIQEILDKTSKKETGRNGYPDLIYINENKKLLILVENKDHIKDHVSKNEDKPADFAVDGIKHYLSFFTDKKLSNEKETIKKYLKNWKIIGVAFSGDINDEYNHRLDTYIVKENEIQNINKNEILDENDYFAYFENIDLEKISNDISRSSSEINRLLRNLDSQKRPILLSALMICLYPKDSGADFKNSYSSWNTQTIIRNIPTTISDILESEKIDKSKIEVLTNELTFIKTDTDLTSTDILKDILKELEERVIPLFDKKTSYDIIGKFYEEFLRYAGITNVKKGIVLTPNHITTLFTELIDIKTNDVIFDPACGTGAFLIAGMNKLISEIEKSNLPDKNQRIKNIKTKQLIGFEKSSTMYSLAISNMLFRGDGKSQIFNEDFFSTNASDVLDKLQNKPTIGFVNPPYGGKDNETNPTKKEIQFLEKMLDSCSRYGIIIAPLSTYFKDDVDRNRILAKHTLKYVINMQSDLFQPNASTHTAIAVFETNKPHNKSKVVFYDLKDDGFVLSKNKGRTDVLNKWNNIKKELLKKITNPKENEDLINLVYKEITGNDEWIIQAHSKTNYKNLSEKVFEKSIKEYVIFSTKLKLNLIDKDIDEITLLEILNENNVSAKNILNNYGEDYENK
ncbi:type II restriction endonuclease subunit M [Candidatus Nomurabacteria bacterium RIFCSPHIGHO2_01_FULL_39_220]|uniref:site-specific DNA-methyltransferase (adenine-specific) n=1 Tax=Candidatus Nomurabacteria bacterium RIFCSPLOWO2_02_FULL_40_67 TaxID=1801787 RepID=A0A1F6Y5W6_9BACT|nr:MAG: Type II DNA modification (Methyltransferase subunit) [Parcubacteria group bacterium GW2011_GWA2_40_37]KKS16253.1 MAG: Type II DNA modification (Methyltransferase subunit) [Parcubacteria group bacterium GW2011_GWB1_41_6]KKS73275.1 MAG: Type II DNA modification (Methyltransferase subunit) [Parcubacteria group bacterium GW2011_GWF2_42_7]OGI63233.1 MAG: type II restriction endonuclease subunit M [Candidatus Nomurabacteria bacterium RBG_16_40_11]OGI70760.1 MAG: type II restriction endonuclea